MSDRIGPEGAADVLLASFARWAANERVAAAAEARSRERWLRQQAAEAATMVGTLVDLAEQRAEVAVLIGTRTVSGRLVGIGRDACVVAEASGAATIIPLGRVVAVRLVGRRPGTGEASGERPAPGTWRMVDALEALAAERSPVRLGLLGGEILAGVLLSVGEDILTVQLATGGQRAYIALASLETTTPR